MTCKMTQTRIEHWTSADVNYIKEFPNTDYTLRAHAELPNYDFPFHVKSFTQFRLTCPSPQNKNSMFSEGILTFDKLSGVMKMKKWNKQTIRELRKFNLNQLSDSVIATKLNDINKSWNFTAMAVKRKRHRLHLLKKQNSVINESTFFVKLSHKRNGLGFSPAYMPLELIKRFDINDGDVLLFRKDVTFFFSRIRKMIRSDRPNDYYSFYIPFRLIYSSRFNEEKVEYIGKVTNSEKILKLISNNQIDISTLLDNKINKKVHFCLHPSDKNKILIGNEKISIPIELSRYLQLSEELFQCLGLFQGEGSKGHFRRIEFVNSDLTIINKFLGFFEKYFSINRNRWRCRVIYTNETKDEELEKELINLWSKGITISKNNFVKTKLWTGVADAKTGSIHIYLPSSALREIWFHLLSLSHKLVSEDKNYAKWFLQGVLAADGCPIFSRGKLSGVMVRIENQYEGELYQHAFRVVGISANLSLKHRKVSFYGFIQLQEVSKLELFKLHKERNERFMNGLINRGKNTAEKSFGKYFNKIERMSK